MNKQLALTALNLVGLVALGAVVAARGPEAPAAPAGAHETARRLSALEQRLDRLELEQRRRQAEMAEPVAMPATRARAPEEDGPAASAPVEPPAAPAAPAPAPGPAPAGQDRPVLRAELEALVEAQLARREAAAQQRAQAAMQRPKRPLGEVARELGFDARQEAAVRDLLRQLERDSMKLLFEVDDAGIEQLKADLARAEQDPRLKDRLRERLAVNWTKRQSDVGVLWVRLDARLKEHLGPELQAKFYRFEAKLEQPEFPDLQAMFWPQPAAEKD